MYLIDNNEILSVKKNINVVYSHLQCFQEAPVVKNPPASTGDIRDAGSIPGFRRPPGGGHRQPTPVFLPRESHGQQSLVGYSPWGHKELDMRRNLTYTHAFSFTYFNILFIIICPIFFPLKYS